MDASNSSWDDDIIEPEEILQEEELKEEDDHLVSPMRRVAIGHHFPEDIDVPQTPVVTEDRIAIEQTNYDFESKIPRVLSQMHAQAGLGFRIEDIEIPESILRSFMDFKSDGSVIFPNGARYQGEWKAGFCHGKGSLEWPDGTEYIGDFCNGKIEGEGTYHFPNQVEYSGQVQEGMRHGVGTLTIFYPAYSRYEGWWRHGKRHGKGRMVLDELSESWFEGNWEDDRRNGEGTMVYQNGDIYKGEWKADSRHGRGQMRWVALHQIYEGSWKAGVQDGEGEHAWLESRPEGLGALITLNRYRGSWVGGVREGTGSFEYADGSRYRGSWKGNRKHGKGVHVMTDGRVLEGVWDQDKQVEGVVKSAAADGHVGPRDLQSVYYQRSDTNVVLYIEDVLEHEESPHEEMRRIQNSVLQHMKELRSIYASFAPRLRRPGAQIYEPLEPSAGMSILDVHKFARFSNLLDASFGLKGVIKVVHKVWSFEAKQAAASDPGSAKEVIFRQFLETLVRIAAQHYGEMPTMSERVGAMLYRNVVPVYEKVTSKKGAQTQRLSEDEDIAEILDLYMDHLHDLFENLAASDPVDSAVLIPSSSYTPSNKTVRLRSICRYFLSKGVIRNEGNSEKWKYSGVVCMLLAVDLNLEPSDSYVADNATNLDVQLTFTEFLDGIVKVALEAFDAFIKEQGLTKFLDEVLFRGPTPQRSRSLALSTGAQSESEILVADESVHTSDGED